VNERGLDDLAWLDDLTPEEIDAMTPGERIGLTWARTVAEYLKRGIDVRDQPLRRDLARLVRRLPDGTEQVLYSTHPGEQTEWGLS
jgi:hypothetical protein